VRRVPELLAPAGSPEALRAAVQNGADAVYLGWGAFNARRGAKNFSDGEFAEALVYCHVRGVRVFLTLNTLLTDQELPQALEAASTACRLGVDAVLVQDWGLLDLLRRSLPDLPLHASTQMSIFTSGGACEAARDGCERVVIARECSREDTEAIIQNCPAQVEVFAHGALCMCYSGQCAMSAVVGGRSGNRGRCAQPCRLPYGVNEPAKTRYPLSLKDNCLAGELGDLAELGVDCVKLEGRMKRAEYVAVVTGIYARLLAEKRGPTAAERRDLEAAFSRSGFTDWYWRGRRGAGMFGTRPKNTPEPKDLFSAAKAAYEKDRLRTVPVCFDCTVRTGRPCTLSASDGDGHTVTALGPVPEPARSHPLTAEELESRFRKTGGTAYVCSSVTVGLDEGLSLPASAVNALRRDALDALSEARACPPPRRELPPPPLPGDVCAAALQWTVSVASAAQLSPALMSLRPARIYVPLELLAGLSALPEGETEWCAILPRVWRDRDEPQLRAWLGHAQNLGISGVLAGNIGHLPLVRDSNLYIYGDFGLNVFNSRALDYLRGKGLRSACVSFELRFSQIRDLRKPLPLEAIVYGRLPLMITENCLLENSGGCRCGQPNFLQDRTGASFPLLPAYGHRTEIENSKVLWLADLPDCRRLGLHYARLRFTTERPEECVQVFQKYLSGEPASGGFTRGLYRRGVE
jgi:putative protease